MHRDGELPLDGEILRLSDEDSFFDRLHLRLSMAPKHGFLVEAVSGSLFNSTTNTTELHITKRKLAEGEQVATGIFVAGRLR